MADTSVKVTFIGDAKKLKGAIDDVDKQVGGLGNKARSFGNKFTDGFSKALPVLAGVGAGVAILGSAVKAAIEDEAAASKLAETLKSVAGATNEQIAAAEKWIDVTQRATGVADDELRPALDVLVRSSEDLETAQKNLKIAMDVSRGTGKDLDTVAQALAKVLEGNTTAAARLVPELTGIAREGASADEVMASLAETFKGQTEAHAATTAGTMERLNIAFGEMKEKVGAALLPKLTDFGNWMIDTGIPKAEQMATDVKVWWGEQEDLHKALRDTAVATEEFAIAMRDMTEDAAAAYDKIAPLVDIMWDLYEVQNKFSIRGIGASVGGKSVNEIIQEKIAAPGSGITGGFQMPPKMHSGGMFHAPSPGGEGLAILKDRERVLPPGQSGGGNVINVYTSADPQAVVNALRRYMDLNGSVPITVG